MLEELKLEMFAMSGNANEVPTILSTEMQRTPASMLKKLDDCDAFALLLFRSWID